MASEPQAPPPPQADAAELCSKVLETVDGAELVVLLKVNEQEQQLDITLVDGCARAWFKAGESCVWGGCCRRDIGLF